MKALTCSSCSRPITRHSKSGRCQRCQPNNNPVREGLTVEGDKAHLSLVVKDNPRTLADLIRVCQIDTDEWTVERWVANKWESVRGDSTVPLFQVKAWLVRNKTVTNARERIAELVADAKKSLPAWPSKSKSVKGAYALEISIPDLHLGKLAWAPETGYQDYDLKTAMRIYETALETLLQRASHFTLRRILFPVGNDFLHADTKQGTTTKGTPLDTDSRWHKAFTEGRKLLTRAIDRLRTLAPVSVVVVPGNHDSLSAFSLGHALECWFHRTKDVTIDNAPIPRKYAEFGQTMILYTHGDKGKRANYPLLMATEQREMFGRTRFHEAHVGHLHKQATEEYMGVRVRTSPALCPPDAWHSENHFLALQAAEAFVWHETEGLIAQAHYTVPA